MSSGCAARARTEGMRGDCRWFNPFDRLAGGGEFVGGKRDLVGPEGVAEAGQRHVLTPFNGGKEAVNCVWYGWSLTSPESSIFIDSSLHWWRFVASLLE